MKTAAVLSLGLALAAGTMLGLAAGPARAQTANYAIDPTHTFVNFEVPHFNTSVTRGRWNRKEGTIAFDRAAQTGRAEITLDMASISTGVAPFDSLLKGESFFDAERFPTASFSGERFVFEGDRLVEVGGELTMRGQTHPVTLKAALFNCYTNPIFRREVCGGDFEATIQRSLWLPSAGLAALAPDRVRLLIQIEAIRQ